MTPTESWLYQVYSLAVELFPNTPFMGFAHCFLTRQVLCKSLFHDSFISWDDGGSPQANDESLGKNLKHIALLQAAGP